MHFIDFNLLEWPSGQSTKDLIKVTNKNVKVENLKVEALVSGEKSYLHFANWAVKRYYQQVMNHERELSKY